MVNLILHSIGKYVKNYCCDCDRSLFYFKSCKDGKAIHLLCSAFTYTSDISVYYFKRCKNIYLNVTKKTFIKPRLVRQTYIFVL